MSRSNMDESQNTEERSDKTREYPVSFHLFKTLENAY